MELKHLVCFILVSIGISITTRELTLKSKIDSFSTLNRLLFEDKDEYETINKNIAKIYRTKNSNVTIPSFQVRVDTKQDVQSSPSIDTNVLLFVLEKHIEYMFQKYFPKDKLLDLSLFTQENSVSANLSGVRGDGRKALMLIGTNEQQSEEQNNTSPENPSENTSSESNSNSNSNSNSKPKSATTVEEVIEYHNETLTLTGFFIVNSTSSTTQALSQPELMSNFIAKGFNGEELQKLLQDCTKFANNIVMISFLMIIPTQEVPGGDDDNENSNIKFNLITGMLFTGSIIFIAASGYAVHYANKKTNFFKKDKVNEKACISISDCGSTKGDYACDDTLERIGSSSNHNGSSTSSTSSISMDRKQYNDDEISSCASYDYSVQNSAGYGSSLDGGDSTTLGDLDSICDKVGSILDDLDATHMITSTIQMQHEAPTPMVSNSIRKKSVGSSNSFHDVMGIC